MLHRAIFGSLERFFAILLEHHAGRLPAWLAPVQAVVMTITDRQDEYVRRVAETLKNQGFRVESDLRNEKVGFKIREHTLQRVPYLLVAGDKEVAANLVVRAHPQRQGSGHDVAGDVRGTSARRARKPRAHSFGGLTYRYMHRSASGAMRRSRRRKCA